MAESLPIVLVPGLNCSPRLYAPQMPDAVAVRAGDGGEPHPRRHMAAIARRILEAAPPRFALAGLSMGGYIALEIVRQAAEPRRQAGAAGHRRARRSAGGAARCVATASRSPRAGVSTR